MKKQSVFSFTPADVQKMMGPAVSCVMKECSENGVLSIRALTLFSGKEKQKMRVLCAGEKKTDHDLVCLSDCYLRLAAASACLAAIGYSLSA